MITSCQFLYFLRQWHFKVFYLCIWSSVRPALYWYSHTGWNSETTTYMNIDSIKHTAPSFKDTEYEDKANFSFEALKCTLSMILCFLRLRGRYCKAMVMLCSPTLCPRQCWQGTVLRYIHRVLCPKTHPDIGWSDGEVYLDTASSLLCPSLTRHPRVCVS